ncbi:leucine-rich repeat-containing protein 58 [Thrips palmi]|uniref:Leucine-rich repeat-containing protein 58 n=1 Tax=Thrips palmi TaxID=161013 RepID=A0A6P9A5J3_THRPL|nr:leucine-rich repeat-containing protein 58 [Thrips palmi]
MQDLLEMENLALEIVEKRILHWNCRGYVKMPKVLKNGQNINEIYLKWNKLSHLPHWIGKLKNITNLYLQHNQLVCLPEELGELSQLTVLDVTSNLICNLPAGIGHLHRLNCFLAAKNALSCIPDDFQMLQSLQILDFSCNSFKRIPDPILKCRGLQEINFDNNCLTSLPDNIVYLPHLSMLSVCGNKLLYLPFLPFMSNPFIAFENNCNLNYLSIWQGQQISSKSNGIFNPESPWNLPRAQGCFCIVLGPSRVPIGDIRVRDNSPGNGVPLVLPSRLKLISSGQGCQPSVPSLLELALRTVYSLGYNLSIQRKKIEKGYHFGMTRFCSNYQIYDSLPLVLQQQLTVGPTTLCYLCNSPIFTCGVIWVVMKEYYIEIDLDPLSHVLCIIVFCSVSCSSLYSQSERESIIHNNLVSRKLNWFPEK